MLYHTSLLLQYEYELFKIVVVVHRPVVHGTLNFEENRMR